MIKEIKESKNKPFYGTLIMLSNHTPFDDVEKYGEFDVSMNYELTNDEGIVETLNAPYLEGTKLGNYFKSCHYADEAISEFINMLDQEGLLENTVLVFYGDHDSRMSKKEYNLMYNYDPINDDVLDSDDPNYDEFDYSYYFLYNLCFYYFQK